MIVLGAWLTFDTLLNEGVRGSNIDMRESTAVGGLDVRFCTWVECEASTIRIKRIVINFVTYVGWTFEPYTTGITNQTRRTRNMSEAGLALRWLLLGFPLLPKLFVVTLYVVHVTVVLALIPPFVDRIGAGRVVFHLFVDLLVNAVGVRCNGC